MKESKSLREIINMYDHVGDELDIQYRTYYDGEDLKSGSCRYIYSTGELIPDDEDRDYYDLNDEMEDWEMITDTFSGEQLLIVWNESISFIEEEIESEGEHV